MSSVRLGAALLFGVAMVPAAFAQTSVTMYGIADAGVSLDNNGVDSYGLRVNSGYMSSSRFGVTGTEGFNIDNTWLQQTVLHEMSFSIPSARYADKADGN